MDVCWKVCGETVDNLLRTKYPDMDEECLGILTGIMGLCFWYRALGVEAPVGAAFRAHDRIMGWDFGYSKSKLRIEAKILGGRTSDPFIWLLNLMEEVCGDEDRVSVTAGG